MNHDRVLKFLTQGLTATQVASIMGCTPAYIVQLKKEPAFALKLEAAIAEATKTEGEEELIDARYLAVEHQLLKQISDVIPQTTSARELAGVLTAVTNRQDMRLKRLSPAPAAPAVMMNIVQLTLPSHVLPQAAPVYTVNSQQEVTAIEGKVMAPLSSGGVANLFSQIKASKEPIVEQKIELPDPSVYKTSIYETLDF